MELLKTLLRHPLTRQTLLRSFFRAVYWQFVSRINSKGVQWPFVNNTFLWVKRGMKGATGNVYTGIHEFSEMSFLLHFLRAHDVFVDIGANVGTYSVLGAGVCGASVKAFEPVRETFLSLKKNIEINNLSGWVEAKCIAIGSEKSTVFFTTTHDAMNHVVTDAVEDRNLDMDLISVELDTLDSLLEGVSPILIKIDVEGYETEVLRGAKSILKSNSLRAIIIELNGSGELFGFDESLIHEELLANGFKPFLYEPFTRTLENMIGFGVHNTIYLRDVGFVSQRLLAAPSFTVLGKQI